MIWLRNRLRAWLGIDEDRADFLKMGQSLSNALTLTSDNVATIVRMRSDILQKQNELSAALQQVRELKELVTDPKRTPIKTRTWQQARALLEIDG